MLKPDQRTSGSSCRRYLFVFAAAALVSSAYAPAASANLITNGSFEVNGGPGELAGGISYATGWTVGATLHGEPSPFVFVANGNADSIGFPSVFSPPNIFVWGPGNGVSNGFTGSPDGGYFLGVDGDYADAPVYQAVNGLTVGDQYTLDFEWAASQFTNYFGATNQNWNISFGSDTASTPVYNLPSQGFSGWMDYTTTFVASSTSQLLSFLAVGTPSGLPPFLLLDGVSLTDTTPASTPEPGTGAALLGGLAGCAGLLRIRKRLRR